MITNIELLKKRVNFSRYYFFEELEKHLLAFDSHLFSKGQSVIWNSDEKVLENNIIKMLPNHNHNKVCFSNEKFGESFAKYNRLVKRISREIFEKNQDLLDVLVLEADFGIVENGSIVIMDQPETEHLNKINYLFIVLDISKVVVKYSDFENILYLREQNGKSTNNIKIINSSFYRYEKEQFEYNENQIIEKKEIEIKIFLYDNKISNLLENVSLRESLYCIHCGKCATVCPVYQYSQEFTPIELIKSNIEYENIRKRNIFKHTTLCGNCDNVCPVLIPMTEILVREMEKAFLKTSQDRQHDYMKTFLKRSRVNKLNNKLRRYFFIKRYFGKNKKLYQYFRDQKESFFNIFRTKTT